MRERHGGTALLPPQAATVARRPAGLVQVVLADEAPLMHLAVRSVLAAMPGFTLAAAAAGLAEAEQLILRVHPDLLVTDADLAGESGIALCRWARQAYPGVVTVILTNRDEPLLVQAALAAGVSAYLLKSSAQETLTANLCVAVRGERVLDDRLGRPHHWRGEAEIAMESGLSRREREVLGEMLAGHSNKIIASALCISEDTVKSHVKAIFRKLGARDRAHAVALALGTASVGDVPGTSALAGAGRGTMPRPSPWPGGDPATSYTGHSPAGGYPGGQPPPACHPPWLPRQRAGQ